MLVWLGRAGVCGGLLWATLAFFPPEDEVTRNRLWTPALLGIWLGALGVWLAWRPALRLVGDRALGTAVVGLGLMTLGNLVEYWGLSRFPHEGGPGAMARGIAWMTFLLGVLLLVLGTLCAGVSMLRTPAAPRLVAGLCMALVPATIVGALLNPGFAALPLACLGSALIISRPSAAPA